MTRRRVLLAALALALLVVGLGVALALKGAVPHVRDQVVAALNDHFDGEVALEALDVSVFPRPKLSGAGATVWRDDRADVPVLRIGSFAATANPLDLLATPMRLDTVKLDRLEVHVLPGGVRAGNVAARVAGAAGVRINEIIAHEGRLEIESRKAGKLPRIFDIHDLHIHDFGGHDGARFEAVVMNPTPEGRVDTEGVFGPWRRDDPGRTPLRGEYTFKEANLNTIKGVGGTLSSRGTYGGVLERIEVSGETTTPNFSIDVAGQPVPLTTTFKAIVDGTNGDTRLEQVDAKLLSSRIHARGSVVRAEDIKGRHVTLDITVDQARIEDLLKLAMKGAKAPLVGAIRMKTNLLLPAGKEDLMRKLQLDGEFTLDEARFTNLDVQRRISQLSQRGQGDETPDEGESVVSKLQGRFRLNDAALSFSELTFAVPGAAVQLAGTYHLEAETVDFAGHLLLDASLRDTTSGFKAVLATLAQPFFRRPGGGTKLPIRISGTRAKPQFGLDVKRAFLPGD